MTVPMRTISPSIKKLPRPLSDRLTREYAKAGKSAVVSIENSAEILPEAVLHVVPLDPQKQDPQFQFENWIMPEMPDGYIKASRNELF
jgi:hypothetical protein